MSMELLKSVGGSPPPQALHGWGGRGHLESQLMAAERGCGAGSGAEKWGEMQLRTQERDRGRGGERQRDREGQGEGAELWEGHAGGALRGAPSRGVRGKLWEDIGAPPKGKP